MNQEGVAPLAAALQSEGGVLGGSGPRRRVESFGDVSAEYRALTEGVAVVDRSEAGRVEHTGPDALDLLHRLTTNDLMALEDGQAVWTVLTSDRGRVVDVFLVLRRAAGRLLLLTEATDTSPLTASIEKYTIIEDAELRDVTDQTSQMAIAGPEAGAVVGAAIGEAAASLEPGGALDAEVSGVPVEVLRVGAPVVPGWTVVTSAHEAAAVWHALTGSGATPAGSAAFETFRIELGVPASGAELTEQVNPLEVNLMPLVSFTKGCYVGQEVVARLDTYDKVQRRLVGLLADAPMLPGEALTADGREVGRVTSVAVSPVLNRPIGLGIVRRSHAEPGARLGAKSGLATVAALPLVG